MGARIETYNDKYLQSGATTELFTDFITSFLPHPKTGRITMRKDIDSVKQALRNLILTDKYERRKNPEFGCNIRHYLFENFGRNTEIEIKNTIENTIENFEPRVRVLDVIVNAIEDKNRLDIRIEFSVLNSDDPQALDLTLYRVR
jgi:phage baseplate assembly protein W